MIPRCMIAQLFRPFLLCALMMNTHYTSAHEVTANQQGVLLQKPLAIGLDELQMRVIEIPSGAVSPVHRHQAQVFVYLLEGQMLMQVAGEPEVLLKAGDTFYEKPDDIHLQARNLDADKPARFLVFLVKQQGLPAVLPVK